LFDIPCSVQFNFFFVFLQTQFIEHRINLLFRA